MPSLVSARLPTRRSPPRSPFGHRRISTVLHYARTCARPPCIPITRPRGAKGAGLRFERAIARALPGATRGQWFEFEDFYGHGYCQTDFLWDTGKSIIVVESKLTDTPAAPAQLRELYIPVVERAFGKRTYGLIIVKNLMAETDKRLVCDSVAIAVTRLDACIPIVHWLGRGTL